VVYKNFIGHRYLLTVIIPVAICSGYWILKYSRFPKILFAVVAGIVVSGYFWIYPDRIAQGWDATPAHWSFYKVRKEMLSYLSEKSIPVDRVGSYFPNIASFKYIDLSPEDLSFSEANIGSDDYILFSNVFNVPDEIQDDLLIHEKWNCLHKIKKRGVYMILYQRRKDK
jgi:hypothetical protein